MTIPHIYHLLPGFLIHGALSPRCSKSIFDSNLTAKCEKSSTIKFHFDQSTGLCMNFRWDGCKDQENKFDSLQECASTCLKSNYKGCPFHRNPAIPQQCASHKDCNWKTSKINSHYCTRKGICCQSKDLEELRSEFNVTCPDGRRKVEYTYKSTTRLLIGKTCSSNICPLNAMCHQKKYFSFCCKKKYNLLIKDILYYEYQKILSLGEN
ncbi:BPTI/Kunitz inhibitor domain-containing protein [Caenorhabditis elegans]|uniref:BPTI/Kunitz inhibitor domain-containing protein n=1 Tax=Caenorhabditis elegans TaxID=6239 RepID=Q94164_CAEEL|nr:BPTI/Kunitz inhibitor domain-containing protein [Caenorhabditis elegans]CCD64157.1 BPTI/Kunitz inhibitor domain-containing protein [Caenorhabditis elegans]|eukprot:NP_504418.1 Uncharacterized protein CELE_C10G8.2 [Caenorhabditis elegans]